MLKIGLRFKVLKHLMKAFVAFRHPFSSTCIRFFSFISHLFSFQFVRSFVDKSILVFVLTRSQPRETPTSTLEDILQQTNKEKPRYCHPLRHIENTQEPEAAFGLALILFPGQDYFIFVTTAQHPLTCLTSSLSSITTF